MIPPPPPDDPQPDRDRDPRPELEPTEEQHLKLVEIYQKLLRRIDDGADPEHEMREFQRAALTTLTTEQRARVEQDITDKDVVRRFRELSTTLRDVVQGEKRLIAGESLKERAAQYEDLVCHIRELWRDATAAFDRSRYSTATFLAIACMEEVGKGRSRALAALLGRPS